MCAASNIESIIERQARFWEFRDRLARQGGDEAKQALVHLGKGPYITVSRQLGSGGVDLARRLAAEFGWQLFDREILTEIADQSQIREALLSRLDEQAIDVLNDYLAQTFVKGDPGQVAYVQEMVRVVWGLGCQGSAVILGRGANWVLEPSYGLRIRCVADERVREETLVREGLEPAQAARQIRENDERQAAFIRQIYGRSIDDPLGYDLVLNLGSLDLGTAVDLAAAALRHKLRSREP